MKFIYFLPNYFITSVAEDFSNPMHAYVLLAIHVNHLSLWMMLAVSSSPDFISFTSKMFLVTEAELERLQLALKILSDAEKQLRHSSERSTWFTAALLQLGSAHNLELNRISSSSTSSKRNAIKNSNTVSSMEKNSPFCENRSW